MSTSATPNASRTSPVASPTATWHVGISPVFPESLILSNDSAIETLLTDIPFLSVGLLGFGVLTFFFAMRKFNRIAFYVFASVIVAFVAGVLDVGQVLIRGRAATDLDTDVSSVLPLLIARELTLAISIGIRFLFFWSFVSRPPRGERPLLSRVDSQEQRPNFLRMESDVHSGSWMRWGFTGALLKYILLLAVIAIPILQILWRLVGDFSRFGPIYNADGTLEIVISALFIIKLLANSWLSPLTPRWKTVRDYSPVIAALLIALGVGVGNIIRFEFSETSLGRFLQAVELYILVLYILISSFYKQRTRVSILEAVKSRTSKEPMPLETSDQASTFEITPATLSPSHSGGRAMSRTPTPNKRPTNRLSSWLVPDADLVPGVSVAPRRMSAADRLSSWLLSKRASGRNDRTQSRLWAKEDLETGTLPVDRKTGYTVLPEPLTIETRERGPRTDPYTLVVPVMTASQQRLERITTALNAPPSSSRNGAVSPDGTISSFAAENFSTKGSAKEFIPPKLPNLKSPGSPVYGLDGIVRYYGQPSPELRPDSVQSSGMESLLRQQAELDKSVAELQLFSPVSGPGASSSGKLTVPGGQPESFRSDFSLSNFPEPPLNPPAWSTETQTVEVSRTDESGVKKAREANASAMIGVPITARPSRILQLPPQSRRRQSFPSIARSSSDSAVLGGTSRLVVGTGGVQYDVTSFIGDLTTPALKESFSQSDKPRRPISLVIEQPDSEDISAAQSKSTVKVKPAVQAKVQFKPTTNPAPSVAVQTEPPVEMEANGPARTSPARRTKQGLPSRTKLNISGPIPRDNDERSMAYDRPRRVPPS